MELHPCPQGTARESWAEMTRKVEEIQEMADVYKKIHSNALAEGYTHIPYLRFRFSLRKSGVNSLLSFFSLSRAVRKAS